ncbi:MAG: DNA polymerase III subunit delta [Phycisphaeraceae bacterium]
MAGSRTTAKGPVAFSGSEGVVVLHGTEAFLKTEYLRRLRAAIEQAGGSEVETIKFDGGGARGGGAELAEVLDELRSFGLMQQHKLVVVDEAEGFVQQHRAALERYAESPVESATLVLRTGVWRPGNLDKRIKKIGQIIKCEPASVADAQRWVVGRASKVHGATIAPNVATMLVEHLGTDLNRLDSEIGKLALGSEGGTITAEQVEATAGRASEEKAWEIQQALLSGDAARAIEKLHELVDLAGQPDVLVTYFVSDLVRKLHHASVMIGERRQAFEICKVLKIWPREKQGVFMAAAKKLGRRRSAALLATLVALDRGGKTGLGEMTTNLERFCVQFAAAIR